MNRRQLLVGSAALAVSAVVPEKSGAEGVTTLESYVNYDMCSDYRLMGMTVDYDRLVVLTIRGFTSLHDWVDESLS